MQTSTVSFCYQNGGVTLQPKFSETQSAKITENPSVKLPDSRSPISKRKPWWASSNSHEDSNNFGGSIESASTIPACMIQEPNPHLQVQRETRQSLFMRPSHEDNKSAHVPGFPTKVFTTASSHQVLHVVRSSERRQTPEMKGVEASKESPSHKNAAKPPVSNSSAYVTSLYCNANLNNSTSSVINITTKL